MFGGCASSTARWISARSTRSSCSRTILRADRRDRQPVYQALVAMPGERVFRLIDRRPTGGCAGRARAARPAARTGRGDRPSAGRVSECYFLDTIRPAQLHDVSLRRRAGPDHRARRGTRQRQSSIVTLWRVLSADGRRSCGSTATRSARTRPLAAPADRHGPAAELPLQAARCSNNTVWRGPRTEAEVRAAAARLDVTTFWMLCRAAAFGSRRTRRRALPLATPARCFTRAMLADPRLCARRATSSIDAQTEARQQRALLELLRAGRLHRGAPVEHHPARRSRARAGSGRIIDAARTSNLHAWHGHYGVALSQFVQIDRRGDESA